MNRRFLTSLLVVAAIAAATLVTLAVAAPSTSTRATANAALVLQQQFQTVVKKVTPSVVQIETSEGLGSGIVYDAKGDIVTNAHVVGSARQFTVTVSSGRQYPATLVASYPANDIAVIRVNAKLKPAAWGDSNRAQVGQIVMAIGNPLGLSSSVTEGIVSAIGRTQAEDANVSLPGLIQTSAPINPGNSGGALVDIQGRVIGIPTLGASSPNGGAASGIGFAIPSTGAKQIADQLIQFGKVVKTGRPYLGITVSQITTGGVLVATVVQGGPAAKAGIQPDDVIVAINGKATPSVESLSSILLSLKPGAVARVTIGDPDGARRTVNVTLGELPAA